MRGQGDGLAGGPVAGDLRGITIACGDTEAGEKALTCFAPDPGEHAVGSALGCADAQFDAHGLMPEQGGHDRADEGSHCAADHA
ncbi:hypothetical protein [Streptomyces durocortorensis]|uniref:Uncharacterized protein n=1 Tax=Streptomyces durocortorensis TaxID=2811104 RepID=A0ABS2HRK3_9ACTN|nr:hypothetical protein [Streptomyces durocortorensis]